MPTYTDKMEVSLNNLSKRFYIILCLLVTCFIQDFGVESVRGGGSRSIRSFRHYASYHSGYYSTYSNSKGGAIVGIVIGCIFGLILVVGGIILVCICCRKSRSRPGRTLHQQSPPTMTNVYYPPSYIESQMEAYNWSYDNTTEKTHVTEGINPPEYSYNQSNLMSPMAPPPYDQKTKY